jgi:hypothetical protein
MVPALSSVDQGLQEAHDPIRRYYDPDFRSQTTSGMPVSPSSPIVILEEVASQDHSEPSADPASPIRLHLATARLQAGSQLQIAPVGEDSDGDADDYSVAASLDAVDGCEEEGLASEDDDDFEFHPACVAGILEQRGEETILAGDLAYDADFMDTM